MRTIRDEFDEEIGQNKIVPSDYINSQGKKQHLIDKGLFEEGKSIMTSLESTEEYTKF